MLSLKPATAPAIALALTVSLLGCTGGEATEPDAETTEGAQAAADTPVTGDEAWDVATDTAADAADAAMSYQEAESGTDEGDSGTNRTKSGTHEDNSGSGS